MHIVQHQKWGHAGRPNNVSIWIVFKIIQITKLSQPVFGRDQFTKAQKRKSGAFRSAAVIMNELQRSIEGWEVITWSVAIKNTKILYLPTWLYPGIQASAKNLKNYNFQVRKVVLNCHWITGRIHIWNNTQLNGFSFISVLFIKYFLSP